MGSISRGVACFLLAILASTATVSAQDRNQIVLRDARAAVNAGQRDDAMTTLEAHLATTPRHVDARLLYGLTRSWSGRYDEARRELLRVLDRAPGYTDARAALANVEWWSKQYDRLAAVAEDGLRRQPNDPRWLLYQARALDGMGEIEQARSVVGHVLSRTPGNAGARALGERLEARLRPWSARTSHTSDWFDDGRRPWQETTATFGRVTPVGTILARAGYAERFGRTDTQFEFEAYPRFRPGTYGYVNVGSSADHTLYPQSRVGLELYQSIGNGMLTGRVYHVPAVPSDSTSYHGLARRYFGGDGTSFLGFGYSHGFSRDEIRDVADLVTLNSDTVRAELDVRLGTCLRAEASGSTSRQERLFGPLHQHSLSAGFRVLF